MVILKDKDLLDYNEKVSTYWPEFIGHGKENLTVADIMRHEGGLEKFTVEVSMEDCQTENIKQNSIGKIIEG